MADREKTTLDMADTAHHLTNAGSEALAAFIRHESFSITGGVDT